MAKRIPRLRWCELGGHLSKAAMVELERLVEAWIDVDIVFENMVAAMIVHRRVHMT